jgi:Domain of unknown function (DUF5615)
MAPPRLHLDADTSIKALHAALIARGHDVTRTPTAWMSRDASDTEQLLGATAQGRVLFTFNVRHFLVLATHYPHHEGLLLAAQRRWTLSQLIAALAGMLSETPAEEWSGQLRWLNQWQR